MNPFNGRHFQRDFILWAVRWYCKYGVSYRQLQEMLAVRGDHTTIYRHAVTVKPHTALWETFEQYEALANSTAY